MYTKYNYKHHTLIKHEYIQLYLLLYSGILTNIRVVIHSSELRDMYNYTSIYT